jgi:hypothetical protein
VVVGGGFVVVGGGFGFVVEVVGGFTAVRPLATRSASTPTPAPEPAPAPTPTAGVVVVIGVVEAVALVVVGVVITGVTDQRDELDGKSDDTAVGVSPAPPTAITTPKVRTTATVLPNTFRRPKRARREPSNATATHFQTGSGKRGDAQTTIAPPRHTSFALDRSFRASASPPVLSVRRCMMTR